MGEKGDVMVENEGTGKRGRESVGGLYTWGKVCMWELLDEVKIQE